MTNKQTYMATALQYKMSRAIGVIGCNEHSLTDELLTILYWLKFYKILQLLLILIIPKQLNKKTIINSIRRKLSKILHWKFDINILQYILWGQYAVYKSKTLLWLHEDIRHAANNGSVHDASALAVFFNLNIMFSFFYIAVGSSWNSCVQKKLCECDAEAAKCFKKYDAKFNENHKNYPKSTCKWSE